MTFYSKKTTANFKDAYSKLIDNLRQQGFTEIAEMDLKTVMNKSLNLAFRNYKLLTICDPQFAYNAISLDCHHGVYALVNVAIQEHENGSVEITANNPGENIDKFHNTTGFIQMANDVGNKVRYAIDAVDHGMTTTHVEALPDSNQQERQTPILG